MPQLRWDDLPPEQREKLAKLSPELNEFFEQEKAEQEARLALLMTPEKFEAEVEEVMKELDAEAKKILKQWRRIR